MKRIFTATLLIATSLAIGFGIGMLVVRLSAGSNTPVDPSALGTALIASGIALVVSVIVNTILHEAGHLVAGLATGYKFLSFRIFSKTLVKDGDRYKWKKFNIPGTMGQCLLEPHCNPSSDNVPYFWYNAGGVLVNMLVALAAGIPVATLDMPRMAIIACFMLAATSTWMLLFNAIPMTPGGVPNDGMNILTLWRHPEQRTTFASMMLANAEMTRGKRASEMPSAWFESRPVKPGCSVMEIAARTLTMARLIDEMRLDEARDMGMELLALNTALPQLYRLEVSSDLVYLYLATRGDDGMIHTLWDKDTQRYVKSTFKFMPLKRVTMMAVELLHNHDRNAAMQHYDAVKETVGSYSSPGEARTALAVMDHMLINSPVKE